MECCDICQFKTIAMAQLFRPYWHWIERLHAVAIINENSSEWTSLFYTDMQPVFSVNSHIFVVSMVAKLY
jgi:hypothetical protein